MSRPPTGETPLFSYLWILLEKFLASAAVVSQVFVFASRNRPRVLHPVDAVWRVVGVSDAVLFYLRGCRKSARCVL